MVSLTVLPRSLPRVVRVPVRVDALAARIVRHGNLDTELVNLKATGLLRILLQPILERCANFAANMVLFT